MNLRLAVAILAVPVLPAFLLPLMAEVGAATGQRVEAVRLIHQEATHHGVSTWQMLRVAWCVSRLDPAAYNPQGDTAGLFQFTTETWLRVHGSYPGGPPVLRLPSRFDAQANARAAAYLMARPGGWTHWRACW